MSRPGWETIETDGANGRTTQSESPSYWFSRNWLWLGNYFPVKWKMQPEEMDRLGWDWSGLIRFQCRHWPRQGSRTAILTQTSPSTHAWLVIPACPAVAGGVPHPWCGNRKELRKDIEAKLAGGGKWHLQAVATMCTMVQICRNTSSRLEVEKKLKDTVWIKFLLSSLTMTFKSRCGWFVAVFFL